MRSYSSNNLEQLKILCDNSSTVKLSKNPVLHGRSKHIDVKFYFLRDFCRDETIDLIHFRSEDQAVDTFTKALKREFYVKLRELLGLYNKDSIKVVN